MILRPLIATLAITTLTAPAIAQDQVTFQIDGAAVPFYAPLYAGVEQGFFTDNDIVVNFLYAGASDILTNIAAGNVEFGFPNGDAVVAAVANGLPIKVVHTTYQRGIGALLAKADSGIKSYGDLAGRTVAVTSLGSPNYLQLQVGLEQNGLSLDDIELEVISGGAIVQALQADQVDAIVFSELRKYALEAAGDQVLMILSNDFLPSFGNVVVTSTELLEENPDLVRRFTNSVTESYEWTMNGHLGDSIDIAIKDYTPTWEDQRESLITAFENTFAASVWRSDLTDRQGLGVADLSVWQANVDALAEYGVIDTTPQAKDFVVADPSTIGTE